MNRLKLNLQFFQGEKTEKATPKKRRDAREKGQVVQSKDIAGAAALLIVFFLISAMSQYFISEVFGIYYKVMDNISNLSYVDRIDSLMSLSTSVLFSFFKIVLPILGVALLIGLLLSYFQVGFLFTLEPLKFKLEKISPLKGFKRLFSLKSLVEMIKSILKAAGILIIAYRYVLTRQNELMTISTLQLEVAIASLWSIIYGVVLRCAAFLFIIAIADYAYKKWDNERELKMSKQEIKDEYKQMEGDPFIRSKIKEKQRQMAMSRMMHDVPGADVIITNPTHYAIALVYNREEAYAPKLIAKGKDLIALNIRKVAEEAGVPIVENKPLARTLYATVDLGNYIPPELFEAVADVLAYVYKIKNRSL